MAQLMLKENCLIYTDLVVLLYFKEVQKQGDICMLRFDRKQQNSVK